MEVAISILILLFIIVIIIPLNIKIRVKYNVIRNKGFVCVKLFKLFTMIQFTFKIKKGYLSTINKKGKQVLIPLDFSQEGLKRYSDLNSLVFGKTTLNKATLFVNFGIDNEPFATAIITSVIDVLSKIGFSFIKNAKSNLVVENKIFANFKKNQLKIAFKADASITLFDIVWCLAQSKFIFKKMESKNG